MDYSSDLMKKIDVFIINMWETLALKPNVLSTKQGEV